MSLRGGVADEAIQPCHGQYGWIAALALLARNDKLIESEPMANTWLFFALGSAFFAAMTAILGKLGVSEINSNMATLIRTFVILLMTLAIVMVRSEWQPLGRLSRFGMVMLVFSGIATGLSWLCYYRALQLGQASKVAPVDKLSVILVILFAAFFLGEPLTWKTALGGALVTAGAMVIAL